MKISETHLSYLRMFGPATYSLEIPHSIAKTLEIKGLVEWVPATFGNGVAWQITKKGREAVKQASDIKSEDEPHG